MKRQVTYFGLFFLCLIGSLSFFSDVQAFSLFPLRQTVVVDPGKTAVVPVEVLNDEDTPIQLVPEIDAFELSPDTGHAKFGSADSAKSWIKSNVTSLTLRPNQKKTVVFTISVPPGVPRESHYISLFLKQKTLPGQIGINKRIGTLLFLHVSGDAHEDIDIQDFSVEKKQGKVFIHLQAKNSGNIHLIPNGNVELFGSFGKSLGSFPINTKGQMVLPKGEWRRTIEIPQMGIHLGRIRAELSFFYGITGQVQKQEIVFWFVPWWSLGSLGVLILAGMGLGAFLKKK